MNTDQLNNGWTKTTLQPTTYMWNGISAPYATQYYNSRDTIIIEDSIDLPTFACNVKTLRWEVLGVILYPAALHMSF